MHDPIAESLHWREFWPWLLAVAAVAVLAHALGPILMPFVVGTIFAYLGDPVVDGLERRRFSRTWAVSLVFLAITLSLVLLLLLIAPMLRQQALTLVQQLPEALAWLQDVGLPKLGIQLPDNLRLDANYARKWLGEHWQEARGAAGMVAQSGLAVLATVANIALIPVVSFYLLRDWDGMVAWFDRATPPRHRPLVRRLAGECDEVLGSFIRGQGLVMMALALYYALALWLVGLKLALLVALIAGLLSFVPYLGFAIGFGLASLAMLVQAPEFWPLAWVAIIFAFGQVLEGNVLTPLLVGDKIGVHPVAVIFAIMAGGQLFGFTGVLVALPCAAILAVGVREVMQRWLRSNVYRWGEPKPAPEALPTPPTEPPAGA